jgi:hypothetical protein
MTLHIVYNHQCAKCSAFYIPFDDDVPCPNCGEVEEERFDFISRAAGSLRYNMKMGGSYMPAAWWVGSLGDHILYVVFQLFERYRHEGEGIAFAVFADDVLSTYQWGEQMYLMRHIYTIALRVYEEMLKQEE